MGLGRLPKIAVLASGRGSNFEAIAAAVERGTLEADIVLVATDRAEAQVLTKAKARGIPVLVEKNQMKLADVLLAHQVDLVVLAGYMRILKEDFISRFMDPRGFARIVNIHPSLLPAFPGLDSYRQAFDSKVAETGVTVHFVDHGVDTGPICAQQKFSIADCKTVEDVEARGLKIEHELFPQTLSWILKNQFEIKRHGERLYVQPH